MTGGAGETGEWLSVTAGGEGCVHVDLLGPVFGVCNQASVDSDWTAPGIDDGGRRALVLYRCLRGVNYWGLGV